MAGKDANIEAAAETSNWAQCTAPAAPQKLLKHLRILGRLQQRNPIHRSWFIRRRQQTATYRRVEALQTERRERMLSPPPAPT